MTPGQSRHQRAASAQHMCVFVCVCMCVCIHAYIYIYTDSFTHTNTMTQHQAKVGISTLGLDGILYLLGVRDREALSEENVPIPAARL